MRITSTQLYTNATSGIQATKQSLARLQGEVSSGSALSKPSDDPVAVATSLQLRGAQAATAQYGANIGDGLGWLSTTDAALTTSENLLSRAIDLTVQGGDASLADSGRAALATQLDGLKSDLLSAANTTYLGRGVFAGNSDQPAFDTASYAFSGTAGSTVQRRVSATETIRVDADGAAAFGTTTGTPPTSVFAAIDAVSAALRSGDTAAVGAGLTGLQTALTSMSAVHASVGASYARMSSAKTANADAATTITAQRSSVEDADLTKAVVELQTQQLNYQASLAVTAKVLQPSLLSYLS